ncbi:DUF5081 family protein [Aciduricibacillus chroicocephali]|uniref:DUF5081 family protein n=1 Tax=Aciduricibacillus chroicocephali TaxID=3054939 RepID=A0ABY9KTR4_9BACI|nr:DUF5081 family protein [Bacillaceae bacterium 44XB]
MSQQTIEQTTDFFNVPELYLLAEAFDGKILFGLPDKEIYQLQGDEVFEGAYERLIEKNILTDEGKLTKGGAIIIKTLQAYHQSNKYVRINNMMFAFMPDEQDELILLVEVERQKKYKLFVVSKAKAFDLLASFFPVVLREPEEKERTFLKTLLTHQERHHINEFEPEKIMNLEVFCSGKGALESRNDKAYMQWLVFEQEQRLIMINPVEKKYYHASQHGFLKVLFDHLEFPYQGAK